MQQINFDSISDSELHFKLIENGFPNCPVTETTRNILIKNLNKHISKNRKVNGSLYRSNVADRLHDYNISAGFMATDTSKCEFRKGFHKDSLLYTSENVILTPEQRSILSSKIYAPPVIAFDGDKSTLEDFSHVDITGTQKIVYIHDNDKRNTSGIVNRLLCFRNNTVCKNLDQWKAESNIFGIVFSNIWIYVTSLITIQQKLNKISVPNILISLFVIFFLSLVLMYTIIKPDLHTSFDKNDTIFKICNKKEKFYKHQISYSCIESEKIDEALSLNKQLAFLLQKRAEQHFCAHHDLPSINTSDFVQHLSRRNTSSDMQQVFHNLQAAKYLISQNPQWKLGVIDKNANGKKTTFLLLSPHMPFQCVLYNKVRRFFLITGIGAVVGLIGLLFYIVISCIKKKKMEHIDATQQFASTIINELQNRATSELIINHLRDKLIPLPRRNLLLSSWNKALMALEFNDSRVQFGLSVIHGEEYRTIRWIGNICMESSENNIKKWQSPAFNKVNKITNPPTPCLKIRNMFNACESQNTNLKQVIEQAILSKINSQCTISEIQIDRKSCCVYIRCPTERDAGIIHNEINGWWFDKNLVSIKFLRLQRYISRFPKSCDR